MQGTAASRPGLSPKLAVFIFLLGSSAVRADGPEDNLPDQVRPVPPSGIVVASEKSTSLNAGLEALRAKLDTLRASKQNKELIDAYLPDVEICHRAVHDALTYNEFFKEPEIAFAESLLETGQKRADALARGEVPWIRETGLVFRAYRSRIDGSAQPYGLEIPATYDFDHPRPTRLDFWFHGRGETLSEVAFLMQRSKGQGGKIRPEDAIILHPYGRYSNANKFAGEADLFEALSHAKRDYRIDENRILARGFSMGGAACWQFAVHYPGLWAAAQPGAGFSETPEFLRTFQGETLNATWWQKKLWRWYDATNWAVNLTNFPVIAYSGEIDRQKQAGDAMVAAAEKEGLRLVHLIGPETAHALHPETLAEIESRLASIASLGRNQVPDTVRFVTYTLRYPESHWLRVDGLKEHWEPGRIEASLVKPGRMTVRTSGLTSFSLHFKSGECPLDPLTSPVASVDEQDLTLPRPNSDRSWSACFQRDPSGTWRASETPFPIEGLVKRTGLQGPIDDAFTDAFLHVAPSGKPTHDLHGEWVHSERQRALREWRRQFRGDARATDDASLTAEQIRDHHLVLWGDPSANSALARILDRLPVTWNREELVVAGKSYDAAHHTLAMIYPNPENPARYVVLNSGFTYREYDYLNNARQTPKLPDWAVIDLRTPPGSQYPGKVVAAGFFDENWQFKRQPED
ncbi:MAG: prolyl oligopeptidase family serine peptidase [Verrucomicrobiae bacterium]|nr:prolyl oligopeptidase family serine peptidase [Verrucomicrobiae bacterium]